MKHILLILLSLALSQITYAQNQQNMVASALDEYGKVAGAWFLNERCNYVESDEKQVFKDNVALITVALGKDLGGPKMLYMVQGGAKKATDDPKYSDCSGTTKELFDYGHNHSKNWSDQIRKFQKNNG